MFNLSRERFNGKSLTDDWKLILLFGGSCYVIYWQDYDFTSIGGKRLSGRQSDLATTITFGQSGFLQQRARVMLK